MRGFILDIRNAIAGSSFIQDVRGRTFGEGAWFIVALSFIQTVVLAAVLLVQLAPVVAELSERDLVAELYPEGLVVTVADGVVSTNVEEPYVIATGESGENADSFVNAFVIDTSAENPLDALETYDTFALLTDSAILFREDTGEIRAFSLKEVGDMVVSEETVAEFTKIAMPFVYVVGAIVALFAVGAVMVFSVLYYLALSVLLAVLVWLVSLVRGMRLSYGASYVVSLYALALPVLVDTALDMFSLASRFSLVLGIFVLVILIHAARYRKPEAA